MNNVSFYFEYIILIRNKIFFFVKLLPNLMAISNTENYEILMKWYPSILWKNLIFGKILEV